MVNRNPKEYIIMDKSTGNVVHEGADRRSILPNDADFKNQTITVIIGVVLTGILAVTGYLMVDKLNFMNDKSDKLFGIVGDVKNAFNDYKVTSESRFSRIETELSDIKATR